MRALKIAILCPSNILRPHLVDLHSLPGSDRHITYISQINPYVSNYGGEWLEPIWHFLTIHKDIVANVGAGIIANILYGIIMTIVRRDSKAKVEIENLVKVDSLTIHTLSVHALEKILQVEDEDDGLAAEK